MFNIVNRFLLKELELFKSQRRITHFLNGGEERKFYENFRRRVQKITLCFFESNRIHVNVSVFYKRLTTVISICRKLIKKPFAGNRYKLFRIF